jgi:hypothetical protein
VSQRWANTLTVAGLVGLLVLVSATAPRWARLFRRPLPGAVGELSTEGAGDESSAAPGEVARTINVRLFFVAPERPGFLLEERAVRLHADLSRQVEVVVEELIRGSDFGLLSLLPPGAELLGAFVARDGIAYVDLSLPSRGPAAGVERDPLLLPSPPAEDGSGTWGIEGSKEELLAVYALVNSIVLNFPAVRKVQILLDGRPATTLAGHVDLSRPLTLDTTLLAVPDPEPDETVEPS